jgi:hypothetical protein
MNEDIDFYNKASRSEESSDDNDDDDIDDDANANSNHVAADAGKKSSLDPDLAGDSGQFKAA